MNSRERKSLFIRICLIEPRIKALHDEIRSIKDDGSKPYFCANDLWYLGGDPRSGNPQHSYKGRIEELVGYGRDVTGGDPINEAYLTSSEAYDIVYQTLYSALPDCRDCDCIATQQMIDAELYQRRFGR